MVYHFYLRVMSTHLLNTVVVSMCIAASYLSETEPITSLRAMFRIFTSQLPKREAVLQSG